MLSHSEPPLHTLSISGISIRKILTSNRLYWDIARFEVRIGDKVASIFATVQNGLALDLMLQPALGYCAVDT